MTATHAATLAVAAQSLDMLKGAVDGLPDAALDWTPAAGMNPLSVLIQHSLTATRFWLAAGAGQVRSIAEYRASDRAASFRAAGLGAAELVERIEALKGELQRVLGGGAEVHLAAMVAWLEDPESNRSGAECLVHGVGHLREHVGHAQAVHDLWMAHSPQNSWR